MAELSPFSIDPWMPIIHRMERGFACFGILLNCILLSMIVHRSPSEIGVYKYLMMYITIFELFFGGLEIITVPQFHTMGSQFFVFIVPEIIEMSDFVLQISAMIYCGSFANSLAIFAVLFAYRYQVLSGNTSWTSLNLRNAMFWGTVPLFVGLFWTVSTRIFLGRNTFFDIALSRDPSLAKFQNIRFGFIGSFFYPQLADGTKVINWDSFIGMAFSTCILFGSEYLMLFYAVKSYLLTKTLMQSACSAIYKKLQWQLFYALVSQTFIPILLMQVPMSAIFVSIFFDMSTPTLGHIQTFTISIYLATDALPTMFIIKPYRDKIIYRIQCIASIFKAVLPGQSRTNSSVVEMSSRHIS
ncbi:Seven TM Receptor [Caenorhabditis elegans]|uniref:Seven TM Receptor n=1 Tax=Caenorhabditis elegans TaxID=6239 RepID=O18080_CAEEL|nr:Seven TM Receptor [Caenorhabditis elegans]CAB07658.1 Seven TM Receptor [Caenorhabditis elegans]|eukprot:NP_507021.1 Seven TM Receptor [Caenorhabditis elegans]